VHHDQSPRAVRLVRAASRDTFVALQQDLADGGAGPTRTATRPNVVLPEPDSATKPDYLTGPTCQRHVVQGPQPATAPGVLDT